jgi:hypothetical protein
MKNDNMKQHTEIKHLMVYLCSSITTIHCLINIIISFNDLTYQIKKILKKLLFTNIRKEQLTRYYLNHCSKG